MLYSNSILLVPYHSSQFDNIYCDYIFEQLFLHRPTIFSPLFIIVHVIIVEKIIVEKLYSQISHSNFKRTHQKGPPNRQPQKIEIQNPKAPIKEYRTFYQKTKREQNSSSSSTTSFICFRSDNMTHHHHPHQPTVTVPISPWLISPH